MSALSSQDRLRNSQHWNGEAFNISDAVRAMKARGKCMSVTRAKQICAEMVSNGELTKISEGVFIRSSLRSTWARKPLVKRDNGIPLGRYYP